MQLETLNAKPETRSCRNVKIFNANQRETREIPRTMPIVVAQREGNPKSEIRN